MAELPADAVRLPLTVRPKSAGMLVARQAKHSEILHALHTSLTLLLSEAQEKRDLIEKHWIGIGKLICSTNLAKRWAFMLPRTSSPMPCWMKSAGSSIPKLVWFCCTAVIKSCRGAVEFSQTLWAVSESLLQRVAEIGRADIATQVYIQESREGTVLCAPLKVQEHLMGFVLMGRFDGQDMFTAGDDPSGSHCPGNTSAVSAGN